MDPINNQLKTLDEMVFANRNKEYGAYFLRKNYSSYLTRAALIGVGFALTLFMGAWGYNKYILPAWNKANEEKVEIDLSKLKQEEVPEEKPDIPPPPPEAPPPPPPEVKQIKFLPPVPKRDEEVVIEEPPPPIEETEKAVISNKTVEGDDVVNDFTPPPPPPAITKPVELEKPAEEEIFTAVEQSPEFPGGTREMYKYLRENIKYPSAAQRANVSGKVFVKFVVERDGSIGNVDVMKGIGFGCDEEAIRVIKSMPKWNPGKQNGKSVRVFYTMPVVYTLE
jgi:periplasmic protein TonB